jgi:predicted nucleic acid-binding protein
LSRFFDTSVLVAAFLGDHPHHEPSAKAFAEADRKSSSCGMHTLAELYSALTSLPLKPAIVPEQALLFLADVRARLSAIALDEADYAAAIERVAGKRLPGARVYDSLLLQCAIKAKASVIYTWNLKHFQQLAPEFAGKMRNP